MNYVVVFDRVGRNRNVSPLHCEAEDADELAGRIYRYARPHLLSADVEVVVDLATGRGSIFCGFNNGGTFTITAVSGGSLDTPGDADG